MEVLGDTEIKMHRGRPKNEEFGIPIRKIRVNAKLSLSNPKEEAIQKIFSEYGKIKDVQISSRGYFFVVYEKPEAAIRALNGSKWLFNRYAFVVKPAEQYHQPLEIKDGEIIWKRRRFQSTNEEECGTSSPVKDDSFDPSKSSLMDLNDDSLLLILRRLTLRELIGVERVCKRMQRLSQSRWGAVRKLNLARDLDGSNINVDNIEQILLRCGSSVEELDLSDLPLSFELNAVMCLIGQLCTNLKKLDLSHHNVEITDLEKIEDIIPHLTSLGLNSVKTNSDVCFWLAERAINLEEFLVDGSYRHSLELSLVFNSKVIPGDVPCFPKLKILSVSGLKLSYESIACRFAHLEALNCNDIIFDPKEHQVLPNSKIKKLNLYGADSAFSFYHVPGNITCCAFLEKMPLLEELTLTGLWSNDCVSYLAELKNLKGLYLRHAKVTNEQLFVFSELCPGILEIASFHGCDNVSKGLLRVIEKNPKLTHLDISSSRIDDKEFVAQVNNYLTQNKNHKLPITLQVTDIDTEDWPINDLVFRIRHDFQFCPCCDERSSDYTDYSEESSFEDDSSVDMEDIMAVMEFELGAFEVFGRYPVDDDDY